MPFWADRKTKTAALAVLSRKLAHWTPVHDMRPLGNLVNIKEIFFGGGGGIKTEFENGVIDSYLRWKCVLFHSIWILWSFINNNKKLINKILLTNTLIFRACDSKLAYCFCFWLFVFFFLAWTHDNSDQVKPITVLNTVNFQRR